jgi:1-acyl-sn-glycerol-3-phosphate acyltransferase
MLRAVFRCIIRLLFALFTRVDVQGLENIPSQGGAILAANHLGIMDSPLLFMLLERDDVTGLVADTYKDKLFFRWIVWIVDGIWINRGEPDLRALRQARDYLQSGGLLGIAPEGTRSRTGVLMPAKTGVAYLADKAGVPLVPIAISATEKLFQELKRLRRPRLRVRVGEPFSLPPLERRDRAAALERNTEEIMCRIAVMLPPEYHGAYANHACLQELLENAPERAVLPT